MLEEILLVDDASDRGIELYALVTGEMFIIFVEDFLKDSLDGYVHKLPVKTIVLRQETREGLVAARLLGAKHANGEVSISITIFGTL